LSDKPNEGLEEIARILNLHAASGILKKPKGCRDSPLWRLFINFEQYRISEKFNSSNPNASLIDQMQRLACNLFFADKPWYLAAVTQLNCIITYSLRAAKWQ
jgi:hypothetical protein